MGKSRHGDDGGIDSQRDEVVHGFHYWRLSRRLPRIPRLVCDPSKYDSIGLANHSSVMASHHPKPDEA
jgi:hypothetical protein